MSLPSEVQLWLCSSKPGPPVLPEIVSYLYPFILSFSVYSSQCLFPLQASENSEEYSMPFRKDSKTAKARSGEQR